VLERGTSYEATAESRAVLAELTKTPEETLEETLERVRALQAQERAAA
jgi:hypothetical protein